MQIHTTIASLRRALKSPVNLLGAPSQTAPSPEVGSNTLGTLGLVPTMGALHEGHLSLIRAARRTCTTVVVSLFINPTQFAPGEDLDLYPRTFAADCALLEREGVHHLFAPTVAEMYPATSASGGAETFIEVPSLSGLLDGASRPGHFRGVATVVAKLFHIVQPDIAFFGQKDAAQLAVIRALVRDLHLPVIIRACPTVRDPDGLALSSRNRFLSATERQHALSLHRALRHAQALIASGTTAAEPLLNGLVDTLSRTPHLRLDYAVIVHPDTLLPVPEATPGTLIAIAAWVGTTRLIDNILAGDQP
jgi:pantoate--beta-alanine ligase